MKGIFTSMRIGNAGLLLFVAVMGIGIMPTPSAAAEPAAATASAEVPTEGSVPAPGPQALIEEPNFDFGNVSAGAVIEHTFLVKNLSGDKALEIHSVNPACGCTVPENYDRTVPPGGTGKIPVTLKTAGFQGSVRKGIMVATSDPVNSRIQLNLVGRITQLIDMDQQNVNFGVVASSESASRTITITSNAPTSQSLTLELEATQVRSPFTVAISEVDPGRKFEVRVSLAPPYVGSHFATSIPLKTNFPEMPIIRPSAVATVLQPLDIYPRHMVLTRANTDAVKWTFTLRNNEPAVVSSLDLSTDAAFLTLAQRELEPGKVYEITAEVPAGFQPDPEAAALAITVKVKREGSEDVTEVTIPVAQSIEAARRLISAQP